MDERDNFVKLICSNPTDITTRLVYADWLSDRGDPRGHFIRLQCALTTDNLESITRTRLLREANELLAAFGQQWSAELVGRGIKRCCYSCGFVEFVELDAEAFLAQAEHLFELAPIRSIKLLTAVQHIEALSRCSLFQRLHSLDLSENWIGDQGAILLAESPYLSSLQKLSLGQVMLRSAGLLALISASSLSQLLALDLSGNYLGECEIDEVMSLNKLLHLTDLRLSGTLLSISSIVGSPHLPLLTRLDLSENDLVVDEFAIEAIASSDRLTHLYHLDLSYNNLRDSEFLPLLRSTYLNSLTSLRLRGNRLSSASLCSLASASFLQRLIVLDLGANALDDDGVVALTQSPYAANLRLLDLTSKRLGQLAATALTTSPYLTGLSELHFESNPFSQDLAAQLKSCFQDRLHFSSLFGPNNPGYEKDSSCVTI